MSKNRKYVRAFAAILALLLFAFSAWQVLSYWKERQQSDQLTEELVNNAMVQQDTITENQENETEIPPISIDFSALLQENSDIVAWIYSPDTPLNYPIVQGTDNDYYLRRLLNGEYNEGGTLFMDYRNQADCSDWNTLIYGHNMKNGSMFGSIVNYRTQKYYDEHPYFYLLTAEKNYKVEVLSGFITDAYSDIYQVPMTQERAQSYVENALQDSLILSNTEYQSSDHLLSLSTCSYDTESSRFVLVGILRELESEK